MVKPDLRSQALKTATIKFALESMISGYDGSHPSKHVFPLSRCFMRISSLFFAVVVVLAVSPNLFAQHSSGGSSSGHSSGGASSAGFSHGSSSGGAVSTSSAGNHNSISSTAHAAAPSKVSSAKDKDNAASEKKTSRSFFHPFRKPVTTSEFKTCLKAPCPVCPGGARNSVGACVPVSQSCRSSQPWNGFSCGTQGWVNDCSSLARQLASQRQQMQSQSDYGQSLRYRMLQSQYQQCLMRDRSNRGTYAFNSALLLDTP